MVLKFGGATNPSRSILVPKTAISLDMPYSYATTSFAGEYLMDSFQELALLGNIETAYAALAHVELSVVRPYSSVLIVFLLKLQFCGLYGSSGPLKSTRSLIASSK